MTNNKFKPGDVVRLVGPSGRSYVGKMALIDSVHQTAEQTRDSLGAIYNLTFEDDNNRNTRHAVWERHIEAPVLGDVYKITYAEDSSVEGPLAVSPCNCCVYSMETETDGRHYVDLVKIRDKRVEFVRKAGVKAEPLADWEKELLAAAEPQPAASAREQSLLDRVAQLEEQNRRDVAEIQRLNGRLSVAQANHESDIARIGERLITEATDRSWCSEYDGIIEDLNSELSVELPSREREYRVTWTETFSTTVSARNEDDAIEMVSGNTGSYVSYDDGDIDESSFEAELDE